MIGKIHHVCTCDDCSASPYDDTCRHQRRLMDFMLSEVMFDITLEYGESADPNREDVPLQCVEMLKRERDELRAWAAEAEYALEEEGRGPVLPKHLGGNLRGHVAE